MELVTLPFLGTVTLEGGVLALILFFLGYILGSGIKNAFKYVLIFVLFMVGLAVLGYLPTNILQRVAEVFSALKPLASEMGLNIFKGTVNMSLISFLTGLAIGLWRG